MKEQTSSPNNNTLYILNINLENTPDGPKGEWRSVVFDFERGVIMVLKPLVPNGYFPHGALCGVVMNMLNTNQLGTHVQVLETDICSTNPKIMGTLFKSEPKEE